MHGLQSKTKESKLLKCACNFALMNDFQTLVTLLRFLAVEDNFQQFINWNYIKSCKSKKVIKHMVLARL